MSNVIVFDFDKTLTNYDTLMGFYRGLTKSSLINIIKYVLQIMASILYKINVINNDRLKRIGVLLFLFGKSRAEIKEYGKLYSKSITLNKIYFDEFMKYEDSRLFVISASFEEYLSPIFPDGKSILIGSQIKYSKEEKVVGLKTNMYGRMKKVALAEQNIDHIDILYTDSFSDKPLMEIADVVYLVKSGKKEVIKNIRAKYDN
ncbi:MAG: haloacid dehalogenase-like hydrolase [Ignavibacteria bacterium]|jgi:phosphoserine phosphatase